MTSIYPGRFTADTDAPFVVFLIGMRINKLLAFRKWVPTAMAMAPMLRSLYQNPDSGFLGGETILYRGGVGLIQYWRSTEDLERFARSPGETHLKAWQRFNQAIGKGGSAASGMKPMQWQRASTKRFTPTCPASASAQPCRTRRSASAAKQRGNA